VSNIDGRPVVASEQHLTSPRARGQLSALSESLPIFSYYFSNDHYLTGRQVRRRGCLQRRALVVAAMLDVTAVVNCYFLILPLLALFLAKAVPNELERREKIAVRACSRFRFPFSALLNSQPSGRHRVERWSPLSRRPTTRGTTESPSDRG
jgi:hypothetical protein